MIRLMVWRTVVLAVFAAGALPGHAAKVYQIRPSPACWRAVTTATPASPSCSAMAIGLGTFNGVDGEMMVLDGRVYRGTIDGRAHAVADSALTPFAALVVFRPQGSAPVVARQSLEQLEAALDALPYSASRAQRPPGRALIGRLARQRRAGRVRVR
jgi:acetolactate decarboxylase